MSVKVKICGIRTVEAAKESIRSGADFLGFNFVLTSKRYIDPFKAKEIRDKLYRSVKIVGVFQDESIEKIEEIIKLLKLDFVQLHGDEGREYDSLKEYVGVIKTLSLPFDFDSQKIILEMEKYNVDYFLLDREKQGEGELVDVYQIKEVARKFPVILAGGLTPLNVREAVRICNPNAVDVAGGIETDGKEDMEKIRNFIINAKGIYE